MVFIENVLLFPLFLNGGAVFVFLLHILHLYPLYPLSLSCAPFKFGSVSFSSVSVVCLNHQRNGLFLLSASLLRHFCTQPFPSGGHFPTLALGIFVYSYFSNGMHFLPILFPIWRAGKLRRHSVISLNANILSAEYLMLIAMNCLYATNKTKQTEQ